MKYNWSGPCLCDKSIQGVSCQSLQAGEAWTSDTSTSFEIVLRLTNKKSSVIFCAETPLWRVYLWSHHAVTRHHATWICNVCVTSWQRSTAVNTIRCKRSNPGESYYSKIKSHIVISQAFFEVATKHYFKICEDILSILFHHTTLGPHASKPSQHNYYNFT